MKFFFVMGVVLGVVLTVLFTLLLVSYFQVVGATISPDLLFLMKDVGGPISAGFGGAIIGACCAYFLNQKNERDKKTKENFSLVYKSSMQLHHKLNELGSIKKHNIIPYCSDYNFLSVQQIPAEPHNLEKLDPVLIDVFVAAGDDESLNSVFMVDGLYRACFVNLANRNALVRESWDIIQDSVKYADRGLSLHAIRDLIGEARVMALHEVTLATFEVLDETILELVGAINKVSKVLKKESLNSGYKLLEFSFDRGAFDFEPIPTSKFDTEALMGILKSDKDS